jgi:hypothetical protein
MALTRAVSAERQALRLRLPRRYPQGWSRCQTRRPCAGLTCVPRLVRFQAGGSRDPEVARLLSFRGRQPHRVPRCAPSPIQRGTQPPVCADGRAAAKRADPPMTATTQRLEAVGGPSLHKLLLAPDDSPTIPSEDTRGSADDHGCQTTRGHCQRASPGRTTPACAWSSGPASSLALGMTCRLGPAEGEDKSQDAPGLGLGAPPRSRRNRMHRRGRRRGSTTLCTPPGGLRS